MGKWSIYDIAYKGLKEGLHEFDYSIDAKFFELFEQSLVENAEVSAKVIFEKRSSLLALHFDLSGTVELTCDRCLEKYNQPVKQKAKVYVKFGEGESEEGDDVFWISPEESEVNIAQLLYEYTVLSIPIKHVHPDKTGSNSCNPDMLEKIKKYSVKEKEETADERWDVLKNLLNNN